MDDERADLLAEGPSESSSGDQRVDEPLSDDDFNGDEDICRVCRLPEGVLYHPCLCTGSIKYVHQECLLEWLKYSKKTLCELCGHEFSFKPVYSKDMPERLPLYDLAKGVFLMFVRFLRYLLMLSLVALCWLAIVPVFSCRINRMVFSGLLNSFLSMKILDIFSTDNLLADTTKGLFIVSLFICVFIALVWLREQVNVGAPPGMFHLPAAQQPEAHEPPPPVIPMAAFDPNEPPADGQPPVDEADQPAAAEVGGEVQIVAADRNNDNWANVDRMADDMTWQRLVGLDGSFVFIENVFWVILPQFPLQLYWPSIVGNALLEMFDLQGSIPYFETPVSILLGYVALIQVVYLLHLFARLIHMQSLYRNAAVIYLMIKVFLLVFTELLFFPIVCGWWLDICSLKLSNSTLESRLSSFHSFPASSIVIHWLAGMLYVFYSASSILALRAILRPGVLWFIRNLNEPDFNPVNEMIVQPFPKHCRRLVASTSLFLSIIFLVVYCPLRIVHYIPNIIPYTLTATEAHLGNTYSLELVLFQIVLPTTLEYMKAYSIFDPPPKKADGAEQPADENAAAGEPRNPQRPPADDLAARHHALLQLNPSADVEEFERPDHFHWRLTALIFALAFSLILLSTMALVIPVTIGRLLISLALGTNGAVHDIYSVGIGFCVCWVVGKTWVVTRTWIQRGWDYVNVAVKRAAVLVAKILLAAVPSLVVIPLLISLYINLLIVGPLRVSIGQTPMFFPAKELAMGILHVKIVCAAVLMGPDWRYKAILEQVYADGIRGFRLKVLYVHLILPVVNLLSILIVAPYACIRTVLLFLDLNKEEQAVVVRMSYPCVLCFVLLVLYLKWQWAKLCAIATKIRNEKYLIGNELVNFYRQENTSTAQ
ncbi:RING-CH-type domain-containing protein [Aphelenchoides fujianensis]|nr:RING-CH-type domain-containing protein [Aphelenchoides fujianensis]